MESGLPDDVMHERFDVPAAEYPGSFLLSQNGDPDGKGLSFSGFAHDGELTAEESRESP